MEGYPNSTTDTGESIEEPTLTYIEICLAMIAASSRNEPVSPLALGVECGLADPTSDESCHSGYTQTPNLPFEVIRPVYTAIYGLRRAGYLIGSTQSPTTRGYFLADEPLSPYNNLPDSFSELIRILEISDFPLTAPEITGLIYGSVETTHRQYVGRRLKKLCEDNILHSSPYDGPTIKGQGKGGNPHYVYSVNTEYLHKTYLEPYIGNLSLVDLAWIHYVYENIIAPNNKLTIENAPRPQTKILLEQTVKRIILKLYRPKNSQANSELSKRINRDAWRNLWQTYHEYITVGDNNENGTSAYDPYIIKLIYYYFDLYPNFSIRDDALNDNFITSLAKNTIRIRK